MKEKNVSANQRLGGGGFSISPKNTNLLEDIEFLLPVKCCQVPFSGFCEEVENVSDNNRPRQPSW